MSRRPSRPAAARALPRPSRPAAALPARVSPRPLPIAVALAFAGGLLAVGGSLPAQAQTPAPATADATQVWDIPAGSLSTALAQFSARSGISVLADDTLVREKRSPGLRGTFTAQAALDALLAGTGLEAQRNAQGQYVLRVAERGSATLPEVTVTAQSLSDESTEGTGSYTTGSMSTATKLPLSIRETPQSVTVVTRQLIEDQGLVTAGDVMRNTPGISVTATSPQREYFLSRGFTVDTVTIDGLAVTGQWTRFSALLNDMAIYDRVEVVRGAAGFTQGAGEPSASINFVRKRPTRDFQGYLQGQLGSWNHHNVEADVSGSLNEGGSLRGRAVLSYTDADSFMDVVDKRNRIIYLIGEADITPSTLLTVGASYQKNNTHNTYSGIPTAPDGSDLHLPRSAYFGTQWDFWNDENKSVFASLEHRFGSQWKIKLASNLIWNDNALTMSGAYLADAETGQYDYGAGLQESSYDRASHDLTASGPFKLFGRDHEAVLGAEVRTGDAGNETAGYWPSPFYYQNIDIYNFNRDVIQADPYSWTKDFFYTAREKQSAIYGSVRWNPADWLKVITGLRYSRYEFNDHADWYDQTAEGALNSWGADYKDNYLGKYAGVLVDVDRHHSVYVSYTDIFQVQTERDAGNRQLDPIEGVNYEIGAKGEYFDGALNIAAALFRVDQKNLAMADGECPFRPTETCYRAAGLVRSEGYDLEIQGAITSNWSVVGGYTYISKKVRKDADPANIGIRQDTHLPTRQFKLASSYRFLGGKARIGGSLRWQNDVWHEDDWMGYTYRTEQKSYAVVNLMAGYSVTQNVDVQLNVSNLFDKWYYSSINAQPMEWGANTVYGEPRKFMLTAKYRF